MSVKELTIEVSHSCEYDCYFCSSKNCIFDIDEEVLWDTRNIERLLDKFEPDVVRWSGGEPFEYLNEEFLEVPKSREIDQIVTTNGRDWEFIEGLSEYFKEIRFSIYGLPEIHNDIMNSEKAFAIAMDSIGRIRLKEHPKVILTTPFISEYQIWSFSVVAKALYLDTRICGLVPSNDADKPEGDWKDVENLGIPTNSCSLGASECKWDEKRLVLPNGKVIHCATEKLGYECPYKEVD